MPLQLPEAERIILRRSPLKHVIVQLRFPPVVSVQKLDFIAGFQEEIRSEYPDLRSVQEMQIQVAPEKGVSSQSSLVWRFLDSEEAWQVSLAPDFVALETKAYESYVDFADRFARVLDAMVRHVRPTNQVRLGLRYINEIPSDNRRVPSDWEGCINSDLLGILLSEIFPADSIRESVQAVNVDQDGGNLGIRIGFERKDEGSLVLLDFDHYDEAKKVLERNRVLETLARYNDVIYRIFRWSIGPTLLQEFEPS